MKLMVVLYAMQLMAEQTLSINNFSFNLLTIHQVQEKDMQLCEFN